MNKQIIISGVTPISSFPKYVSRLPLTQTCDTDMLCIPEQSPSIKSILRVKVNVSVCSHKVISTYVDQKLIIEGVKHINILYADDEPCESVHFSNFDIPFCMFISLKENDCEIIDVFTAIEDIKVKQLNDRSFSLSTILFACPKFKKREIAPLCTNI